MRWRGHEANNLTAEFAKNAKKKIEFLYALYVLYGKKVFPMQEATLVFLVRENEILLGYKKRGFAQGKLNGFGGKIEDSETIESAAARELHEECGVVVLPADLKSVARLDFFFPAKHEWDQVVHVFIAERWRGEPVETDEMKPIWFPEGAIPFDQMWADDQHWLPLVLQGKLVKAEFTFNGDNETVSAMEFQSVSPKEC